MTRSSLQQCHELLREIKSCPRDVLHAQQIISLVIELLEATVRELESNCYAISDLYSRDP